MLSNSSPEWWEMWLYRQDKMHCQYKIHFQCTYLPRVLSAKPIMNWLLWFKSLQNTKSISQACLLNLAQTSVLKFNSQFNENAWYYCIFILCKTVILKVFYKAAVIILVEINFEEKRITIFQFSLLLYLFLWALCEELGDFLWHIMNFLTVFS